MLILRVDYSDQASPKFNIISRRLVGGEEGLDFVTHLTASAVMIFAFDKMDRVAYLGVAMDAFHVPPEDSLIQLKRIPTTLPEDVPQFASNLVCSLQARN
jgi:hypothetical protein